ncbi:nuclear pore complex protein NUP160 [Oryza sativa Japonica Group]|uniref:nuclear pore complex protein NUP160 n=1 Tax=Oryza sativa subsp. japonica TaxID=39947 RepID=UPI00339CFB34
MRGVVRHHGVGVVARITGGRGVAACRHCRGRRYEEDFLPAAAGLPPPPGRLRRCGISSEDAAFWRAEALVPMQFQLLRNRRRPNAYLRRKNLLLPSSDDAARNGNGNSIAMAHQSQGSCHWETLEIYLEKYKDLHPRLPVIVAETLLYTDPEIELPLWLVQMFKVTKAGSRMISWGMSGTEADPATLFRLYINYGRHTEAANLLVEYLESFASSRPVDVLHRKNMSATWFPYTAIERLWCQLEEMQNAGHSVDQCDRLKKLLHGSLMSHLQQVVVDSDDVLSSLGGGKGMGSQSN